MAEQKKKNGKQKKKNGKPKKKEAPRDWLGMEGVSKMRVGKDSMPIPKEYAPEPLPEQAASGGAWWSTVGKNKQK